MRVSLPALVAMVALAAPAEAQINAVRRVGPRPAVILLLDAGETMNFNVLTGSPQQCVAGSECDVSRYLAVQQALVGSPSDLQCVFEEIEPDKPPPEGFPQVCVPNQPGDRDDHDDTGILDIYRDRIRFGMLVTDNIEGEKVDANGGYSYGAASTAVVDGERVRINLGARNSGSSTGTPFGIGDLGLNVDLAAHNAAIQAKVSEVVPFGQSSLDAFLQDAVIYRQTEESLQPGRGNASPNSCRSVRFVLLTDGVRHPLFDGDALTKPQEIDGPAAVEVLTDVWTDLTIIPLGSAGVDGLDPLKEAGAEVTPVADSVDDIRRVLDGALSELVAGGDTFTESQTGIRSTVLTHGTRIAQSVIGQMQVGAAYTVSTGEGGESVLRQGHLERLDFLCGEDEPARAVDLATDGEVGLPSQSDRTVWTQIDGRVVPLSVDEVSAEALAVTPGQHADLINWFHWNDTNAFPFDEASDPRLGAVVRSTPALLGRPDMDLPFQGYQGPSENDVHFKARHRDRPTVALFGANDALLHAFVLAQHEDDSRTNDQRPELWSYLPGFFLDKAQRVASGAAGHSYVDASPVVRTVRMRRTAETPEEEIRDELWRDVVVGGTGPGGPFWYALDVTDVQRAQDGRSQPRLLWEFPGVDHRNVDAAALADLTGADGELVEATTWLGESWSRPALGSVTVVERARRTDRAVAFLPGGRSAGDPNRGRSFYVVQLERDDRLRGLPTVLRSFRTGLGNQRDDIVFPIVGEPVAFHDGPGLQTSRVYVGDEGGRLWRIDVSDLDPTEWTMEVVHDAYAGEPLDSRVRRPVTLAPAVVEDQGRDVIVVYATGDPDDLSSFQTNHKVHSLREVFEVSGAERSFEEMAVNCRIDLQIGEVATGRPLVFDEVVYFSSFSKSGASVCSRGEGRIWAVDFVGLASDVDADPTENVIPRFPTNDVQNRNGFVMFSPPLCSDDGENANPNDLERASLYCVLGSAVSYGVDITFRPLCETQFNDPALYGGEDGGDRRPELTAHATGTAVGKPAGVSRQRGGGRSMSAQLRRKLPAPQNLPMPLSWGIVFE